MGLQLTTDAAAISLVSGAAALPFPPTAFAVVPTRWNAGGEIIPEFDIEIWSSGSLSLTAAELWGAVSHPGSITPTVFTAANATEIFTAAGHGLVSGDGPFQVSNAGGALPAGLAAATNYWVIWLTANTFQLATTRANALAGTPVVTITTDGTGTQTISSVAATELISWHSHGTFPATIALTSRKAFTDRCEHRPGVIAYGLTGTLSAGTVSSRIIPVTSF